MNHSLPAGAWLKGSGLIWPEEDREAPAEDSSFTLSSTVFLIAAGDTVSWSAMVCSSLEKQGDIGSALLRKDGAAASSVGSAQWDPIPGPFTPATPLSVIQLHNHVSHHSVTQGHPVYNIKPSKSLRTLSLKLSLPILGQDLVSPVSSMGRARWLGPTSKPCCSNSDFSRHWCWKVDTGQEGTADLPCRHEPGTVVPSLGFTLCQLRKPRCVSFSSHQAPSANMLPA